MTNQCPRAKSDMTPCYIKDGELAVGLDYHDRRLCVGCDKLLKYIETPPHGRYGKGKS